LSLFSGCRYTQAIHVWDLRAMRERLKGMGLHWHGDEFPPAQPGSKSAELAKLEVPAGEPCRPVLKPK
jgi:hypothetical protein